jgi:hypothetical protein
VDDGAAEALMLMGWPTDSQVLSTVERTATECLLDAVQAATICKKRAKLTGLVSGRASGLDAGLDARDQAGLLAMASEVGERGASIAGESSDEAGKLTMKLAMDFRSLGMIMVDKNVQRSWGCLGAGQRPQWRREQGQRRTSL